MVGAVWEVCVVAGHWILISRLFFGSLELNIARHLFQFPGAYINETDRIFCCNQSFWPVQIERLTQNCELFPTGCWSDLCFPRWFLPIQFSKLNREKRDSSS
jgi:hypothetical protein